MTNDIPMPRFVPPVYRDDEFSEDTDIETIRHETVGCPLTEHLASR